MFNKPSGFLSKRWFFFFTSMPKLNPNASRFFHLCPPPALAGRWWAECSDSQKGIYLSLPKEIVTPDCCLAEMFDWSKEFKLRMEDNILHYWSIRLPSPIPCRLQPLVFSTWVVSRIIGIPGVCLSPNFHVKRHPIVSLLPEQAGTRRLPIGWCMPDRKIETGMAWPAPSNITPSVNCVFKDTDAYGFIIFPIL